MSMDGRCSVWRRRLWRLQQRNMPGIVERARNAIANFPGPADALTAPAGPAFSSFFIIINFGFAALLMPYRVCLDVQGKPAKSHIRDR